MEVEIVTVRDMSDSDRKDIVASLTNPGSEFQAECEEGKSLTPVAVVRDEDGVAAWACTHVWRGLRTLEGFTRESHRRRGYGRAAAFALAANKYVWRSEDVAVFEPEYASLVKSIGFEKVRTFRKEAGDWIETTTEPSGGPAPRVVG